MSVKSSPEFGPRLRAHREQRRITLAALAESIKVKASLLDGLERNDLSGWPPGIYRRALLREYAKAIGFPPNVLVEEFCTRLPEPHEQEDAALSRDNSSSDADAELRMTFAQVSSDGSPVVRRLFGAMVESAGVFAIGCVTMLISGIGFWTAAGLVALVWYPVTAVLCVDRAWYRMLRFQRFRTARWSGPSISPAAATVMSIVTAASDDAAAAALIMQPDVHASTSAPAAVH